MFLKKESHSVAGAILSEDKKSILLILRRDVPVWALPGGGVEENESPDTAVLREIFEETGLTCKINRKLVLYMPKNALANHCHLYLCEKISGDLCLSQETSKIAYFPLEKLPSTLAPPFSEMMGDIINNLTFHVKYHKNISYLRFIYLLLSHPLLIFRFILSRLGMPINKCC